MPKEFDSCVKKGGRVRRKSFKGGYINICFPKGGGPGVHGDPHKLEKKPDTKKK